jgi:hypothetical protein
MELVPLRGTLPRDLKVKHVPKFESVFDIVDISSIFKCRIRILVVTDSGSGGFGTTNGFHLGLVLDVVQHDLWSHVIFNFTKAHRQNGDGDIDNFRFDAHDLGKYDAIWLFGIERSIDPLSPAELRAISQFMDDGGGVFATGDHENLGQPMAAEVPRVRSMRRWYHPFAGPNGEPPAPDQFGSGRHDTLVDAAGNPSPAGDQTDEVPQTIRPRYYTAWSLSPIQLKQVRFPHPVLCGPNGPITHLPDHMHEGLCEVPTDLTKSFNFDGYKTTEYPTLAGHQERPQVIAWANNNVDSSEFGVLAAYDGHRSGVGRVVVDATWHHWFNINLEGFIAATDPTSPSFDPSAVPAWEEIKSYFRNVGVWLAPKAKQQCLRNGGWLLVLKNTEVRMTLRREKAHVIDVGYYLQLGIFARDALGRLASQCQRRVWLVDIFKLLELERLVPDPFWPKPGPLPDPPPFIESLELENVALGAAIHSLAERFGDELDLERLGDVSNEEVEAALRRGAADGVVQLFKRLEEGTNAALELVKGIDAQGA